MKTEEELPREVESIRGPFLIISNISKLQNICRLVTTANAHNFKAVIVGCDALLNENFQKYLDDDAVYLRVLDIDALQVFFSQQGVVDVIGIEISDESKELGNFKWNDGENRIALMPGNEGTGLSQRQRDLCTRFVYIPQCGASIESLNVHVATTLVLHQYCKV